MLAIAPYASHASTILKINSLLLAMLERKSVDIWLPHPLISFFKNTACDLKLKKGVIK